MDDDKKVKRVVSVARPDAVTMTEYRKTTPDVPPPAGMVPSTPIDDRNSAVCTDCGFPPTHTHHRRRCVPSKKGR